MEKRQSIVAAVSCGRLAAACFSVLMLLLPFFQAEGRKLVILHTNDIHSAVDPDRDGMGGAVNRKAIFDSVRRAEKDVLTIDAGDIVQGTLYFKYFRGDVEYPLMDMTGYDIRVLGNHEFDNGPEDLERRLSKAESQYLSANYDFSGTGLEKVFKPYIIKKIGGKKIGIMGLNVNPDGLILKKNINFGFKEVIPVANRLSSYLKKEKGCNMVIAVTHIGYIEDDDNTDDATLLKENTDIDLIIGGHSHTLVDPANPGNRPPEIVNAAGRPIRVVQTGKGGKYIGKLTIDLDKLGKGREVKAEDIAYEIIPVTSRFSPDQLDSRMEGFIRPYREKIDSVNRRVIGVAAIDMPNARRTGPLVNFTADFGLIYGRHKADSLRRAGADVPPVDLAVMNVGGIRQPIPAGDITEGQILAAYPFSNHFMLIKVKGAGIVESMQAAARKGGEAVSRNVRVVTDESGSLKRVLLDGEEIDLERDYVVATIDYLAEGNDGMTGLARHSKLWVDDVEVAAPILRWYERQGELGMAVSPDPTPRFVKEITVQ